MVAPRGVGLQRVVVSEVGMTAAADGGAGQGALEAGGQAGEARKRRRIVDVHRARHRR